MSQSSAWETEKKRFSQALSPVATKMHATTETHSRSHAANETLHEYIVLYIRHVLIKKLKSRL